MFLRDIRTLSADRFSVATTALAGILAISVAVALAGLTWRLAGHSGVRLASAGTVVAPIRPTDISPILALAPFGATIGPAGGGAVMDLHLSGIVYAYPRERSRAIIAVAGQPGAPFAVGQALPNGAVLEAVEIDHVVLRINGQLRALLLDKTGSSRTPVAAPPSPVGQGSLPPALALSSPIAAALAAVTPAPPPPAAIGAGPGRAVEVMRQRAAQSPQSLLASLGAVVTSSGYRIGPSPPEGVRAAGLLPGDVIERVNGVAVGDLESDRRLFDQVIVAGQARVEAVRDGRRMALSFPLR